MNFLNMIKKLKANPDLEAGSEQANALAQNLATIEYWVCSNDNSEDDRVKFFRDFVRATDWKVYARSESNEESK
jgi:hypothetical protein